MCVGGCVEEGGEESASYVLTQLTHAPAMLPERAKRPSGLSTAPGKDKNR